MKSYLDAATGGVGVYAALFFVFVQLIEPAPAAGAGGLVGQGRR